MISVMEMFAPVSFPLVVGAHLTGLFGFLGAAVGPGPPVQGAAGDTAPQKRPHHPRQLPQLILQEN